MAALGQNTDDMPLIFSYGSLREPAVQLSTFGRHLTGHDDELVGFELSVVTIDDPAIVAMSGRRQHNNLVPTDRPNARVRGTVFEITDSELADVDEYEAQYPYRRIDAPLASGSRVWVYVYAG